MSRTVALGLVLALSFVLALPGLAQVPGAEALVEPEEAGLDRPAFAGHNVSGDSVVELADFISSYLAETGTMPDWAQVRTTEGNLRSVSASQVFTLLVRTTYLWRALGDLPERIPIAPESVSGPVIELQDVPEEYVDLETGREILTESFLEQCEATVHWIDRLQVIPTAVWVDGERLSAMQYLAGLAICIQHAYYEGYLYEFIVLPRYAPPESWLGNVSAGIASSSVVEVPRVEEEAESEVASAAGAVPPWTTALAAPAVVATHSRPEIALFPEPGSELSGVVDVAVSYSGPVASFVTLSVDGSTRFITNFPPYGFRWDTTAVPAGTHTVRVRVYGSENRLLVDQISAFTVSVPGADQPSDEPANDL